MSAGINNGPLAFYQGALMNSNIKDHRTATVTLRVSRQDGTPLSHRDVLLAQTRHKFLFGTAAFDLVPLANDKYVGRQKEHAEQRAGKLTALFNAATLPFYWARFEPEPGRPLTESIKECRPLVRGSRFDH